MRDMHMGIAESRFADIIWKSEPVSTTELVRRCDAELSWKKTTTYTVLKRLCEKGIFQNNGGQVTSLLSREEFYARQSERFVEETFDGSLPAFLAAFTARKNLSAEEIAQLRRMVEEFGVRDDIQVSTLSRLPEVFQIEKPQVDEEQLLADLMQVTAKALENYDAMRAAEGAALEQDLRSRGNTILSHVEQVEKGNAQTVIDYRTRLENKLREVLANTSIDESRILTEAAIFADKVAVDEETVRLRSHLQQMNTMLTGGGAVGRKLDFLLQEMNREANTIGSKCTDVRLARIVVDIKAELEKIREQTQNIE